MVDTARLVSDPDAKLRTWDVRYLDGTTEAIANARLLSTDTAFVKFRLSDGRILMLASHAIRTLCAQATE